MTAIRSSSITKHKLFAGHVKCDNWIANVNNLHRGNIFFAGDPVSMEHGSKMSKSNRNGFSV